MPEILIPIGHRGALVRLMTLSDEQGARLHEALRAAPPASSVNELATRIAERASFEPDEARVIAGMLASMYDAMIRGDATADEFAEAVIASAKEWERGVLPENFDSGTATRFISDLMKMDESLGVSAKIIGVIADHDHVYCRARVLTDVRPVFAKTVASAPAVLVLTHTLRLSYHVDGETRGLYVAMDGSDLEDLKAQLDRAIEKEKTLRSLLASKELPVLSASEVR